MKRILLAVLALSMTVTACAAPKSKAKSKSRARTSPAVASGPIQSPFRRAPYVGAVAMNAKTGAEIFSDNADRPAYPASVTKLMTALLVLEDVKAGKYKLTDMITATEAVYKSESSWVGIKAGEKMSVNDMLTALLVESANDAAIALAVNSAGSLDDFVAKMNSRAKELGMNGTTYYNPNGLPPKPKYPWRQFNVTTARDQSLLAMELIRSHPLVLQYTSVKTCDLIRTPWGFRVEVTRQVNGGAAKETVLAEGEKKVMSMVNHNNVMVKDKLKLTNPDGREAVDGLKTGYINAGGSSVVLTGSRGGQRAIVVVLGSASAPIRDENASRILTDALGSMSW